MAHLAAKARVCAVFGTWKMDKEKVDLIPKIAVQVSTRTSLWIYNETYFVKILENGPDGDEELEPDRVLGLEREICMMILAGGDCAVQPVGRVYNGGSLCGVIMHLGTGIAHRNSPLMHNIPQSPAGSLPSPRQLIEELTQLVSRLHTKGIIHGDIKPHNFILDKVSSHLLFCDFGSAALVSENRPPRSATTQYNSPFRTLMFRAPLTKADDLYMTGITMWELYTGRVPFYDFDDDFLEDVIASGFQPNLLAVDDNIRQLIDSYLEAGNPSPPEGCTLRGNSACVTARVVYADCVKVPPHSYEKVVHRQGCNLEKCEDHYHVPDVVSSVEKVRCSECLEHPAAPTL